MKFYLLVNCAFLIPHILGANDTTSNLEHKKSSEAVAKKVHKTTPNVTNTLITEGGTIIQNTPSLEDLITVHKELGNHSHSTIVARKEARLNDTDDYHPNSNATDNNTNKVNNDTHKIVSELKNATEANIDTKNSSVATFPTPVVTKKQDKVKPTKPLVLSYDVLANMDLKVGSESESHKGMPSNIPISKIHPASQHPGMIMPIVIAILVVPMFAVLGYMALRRGQEAWKNRHYKRMDFLLDGMYNE